MLMHELLHARSVSYYNDKIYVKFAGLEEGPVEYLNKQICKQENIPYTIGYENHVQTLEKLYKYSGYETEIELAKALFAIPLPERAEWLQNILSANVQESNMAAINREIMNLWRQKWKN